RAAPGVSSGSALLTLTSRMEGAELNGVLNLGSCGSRRLELIGGFRYVDFIEHMAFGTTSLGIENVAPPEGNSGLVLNTLDRINTQNYFYGGQLGLRGEARHGDWIVNAFVKVALGDMFELARWQGDGQSNALNVPPGGVPQSFRGSGAFVQVSNHEGTNRHEF